MFLVAAQTLNPHSDSTKTLPAKHDLELSLQLSQTPTTVRVLLHTELITLSINFY